MERRRYIFLLFNIAFSFYFFFGNLILFFGNAMDMSSLDSKVILENNDIIISDLINFSGYITTFICSNFKSWSGLNFLHSNAFFVRPSKRNIYYLLAISIFIRITEFYLISNLMENEIIPLAIRLIAKFWVVCLILLGMRMDNPKNFWLFVLVLCMIFFVLGILQFSKTEMLIPIISLIYYHFLQRNYNKNILVFGVVLVLILLQLFSRITLLGRANEFRGMDLLGRIEIVKLGFANIDNLKETTEEDFTLFNRISYLGQNCFAIQCYDKGNGGVGFFDHFFFTFIPRAIYPKKPEMTSFGDEIYYKMFKQTGSKEGVSLFIQGYYYYGYLGVVFFIFVVNFILLGFESFVRMAVSLNNILTLPLIFLVVYSSIRVDGDLVTDYVAIYILVVYYLLILYLSRWLLNLQFSPVV